MMHGLAMCAVCMLVFAPRLASAFELGVIETRSALHEPLDARIPLRGVRNGDLEGLKVSLGSPAQFELAGVARLEHLDRLEFTVVDRSGGAGFIHVRTDEPIIEPSLTFLVDVDWPRGGAVRGYELRLASAASSAGARRGLPAAPPAEAPGTGASASTPASPPASSGAEYGPVRASETLWSIATRLRPDDSVSVQRMMLAILETNPEAFVIPNVNALSAGAILRIPTREEIGPDDMKTALAEVRRQHSAWTRHRERSPAAAAPSAPAPVPSPRHTGRKPDTPEDVAGREEDADIEELRKELARARREADAGRREGSELRRRLAEAEDRIEELRKKLVRARGEAGAGRREGSELRRRLAEAEDRIEELRRDLVRARGEAEAGRPEGSELQRRLAEAEDRIEELRKELVRARGEADAGRREGSELQRRLAEAEDRIEELRKELVRAREEADAGRRESSEQLRRRFAEAEDQIEELNRFVDLKDKEIAALRALVETGPEPADEASKPVAAPSDVDSKPPVASVETGSKSLPFGLGALPVNPMFLVGGAGLLLILLGVVALLRRRRISSGEDDALDSADPAPRDEKELLYEREAPSVRRRPASMHPRDEEGLLHEREAPSVRRRPASMHPRDEEGLLHEREAPSVRRRPASMHPRDEEELLHEREAPSVRRRPASMHLPDEDGLIQELEAVAAELADETGDRPGRRSRAGRVVAPAGGMKPDALKSEAGRSGLGGLAEERVEQRMAELWRDGRATERTGLAKAAADDDTAASAFDIRTLAGDDSESSMVGGRVSRGSGSGTAGSMHEGADSRPDAATGASVGLEPGSDDGSGRPRAASHVPRGEPAEEGGTGVPSFDHIGEDEVQTKIDLAQVYMEMGDTERARGFLEAVVIQGDPVQRGTAREMLSKLA